MQQRDPHIVTSGLGREVTEAGVTVQVHIFRLEHEQGWVLEVVNAAGTSIVWDDPFPSDDDAYGAFRQTVAEEGMQTFLDSGKVIPFKR